MIQFPGDRSFGEIVVRDWGSPFEGGYRSDWEDLGFRRAAEARGPVSVPAGQEAGLALAEGVEGFGEGLRLLQPGDLQYVFTGWDNSVTWTDDDCRHLSRLRGLVWVSLVSASIGDQGLRWLGGMRGLRHLDLHRIPGLTDEGIAHLSGLTTPDHRREHGGLRRLGRLPGADPALERADHRRRHGPHGPVHASREHVHPQGRDLAAGGPGPLPQRPSLRRMSAAMA